MSRLTEKLYYEDAYISNFSATVLEIEKTDRGYLVVLDRTAFFPEEGGQSADTGYIGDARVIDVTEHGGVIYHLTATRPTAITVSCSLDFDERFEKMQLHSAEHILCGIIHKMFGLDNVGFHLGDDEVTFDISSPLTRDQLDAVESAACEAVFRNIRIETSFPTQDELSAIQYRSKLDILDNVRLVKIGDVDTCACCAPHVLYTGEIGAIKLLHAERHRGGMRIWMCAGRRAVLDYRNKFENISRVSALLSVPARDTADALERYIAETEKLKFLLKSARSKYAEALAAGVTPTDGNLVAYIEDGGVEELRSFVNSAIDKVGGVLVALCGTDGDYKYLIASRDRDLSSDVKEYNAALSGRGGGRGGAVQGSFAAPLSKIKAYFEN